MSEVGKAHEKEMADMNAATAVLKAQLEKALADVKDLQQQTVDRQAEIAVLTEEVSALEKKIRELSKNEDEIREQLSATRASLEVSRVETAAAKAVLLPKDAQVDELKRRLAEMEEKSEKTRDVDKATANELEALRQKVVFFNNALLEAEAALNQSVKTFQSQNDENVNLKRGKADLEERLRHVCESREKEMADMNAANAVLKAQLEKALADVKDLQQQTSAMGASLEASNAETASAKAALSSLDKRFNEMHDADEKASVYTQFGFCVNDVQALLCVDYIFMRICTFSCSCDKKELPDKSGSWMDWQKSASSKMIKQLNEDLASD